MGVFWSQSFFIPKPTLTEHNLPDQSGKVFIVTGGYAGVGQELSRILYGKNGTVYLAGRSKDKADKAIASIQQSYPSSKGKLVFLHLDLSDLKTIKPAAEEFMSREKRLDVLTNNAGVMIPPKGSVDAQGNELQMGTNCLGPFLLTKLLQPIMQSTAKDSEPGAVRVTWAGSLATDLTSPKGGIKFNADGSPVNHGFRRDLNYGQSKAGNLFLASESARRYHDSGITHLAWNPGNLNTELQRHTPYLATLVSKLILYEAKFGAYTELWAGLSKDITHSDNGRWVIPWGRFGQNRDDVALALKPTTEGGTGQAQKLWDWCDEQSKQFS